MALALNIFKTVTTEITTVNSVIYTAPLGYSGVVLLAQIANVTNSPATVTLIYNDGVNSNELLKDFAIAGNDSTSALAGKLIIETGKTLEVSASANSTLKMTTSILETANE